MHTHNHRGPCFLYREATSRVVSVRRFHDGLYFQCHGLVYTSDSLPSGEGVLGITGLELQLQ